MTIHEQKLVADVQDVVTTCLERGHDHAVQRIDTEPYKQQRDQVR